MHLMLVGVAALVAAAPAAAAPEQEEQLQLRTAIRRHPRAMELFLNANANANQNQTLRHNPLCGYIATVTIGTPPQELDFLMDTGSANVIVGSTGCRTCLAPLFKPAASSTLQRQGGFDMYGWCTGSLGADALSLAPGARAIQGQQFGMCNASDIFTSPPGHSDKWYNGLFGLGMRQLEQDAPHIVPALAQMKQQGLIGRELFAVYVDLKEENTGEIQWGFSDPSKYVGNLTWHKLAPEGNAAQPPSNAGKFVYYTVNTDSIRVGEVQVEGPGQIMTDTGAVGIYPPTVKILKQIEAQVGPVEPDCSNARGKPDFVITIGGVEYTIPSSVYVLKDEEGGCSSAFQEGYDDSWLMGDAWFRAVYAVFDVDNHLYGMATNVNMNVAAAH